MNPVSILQTRRALPAAGPLMTAWAASEPAGDPGEGQLHALAERLRHAAAMPALSAAAAQAALLACVDDCHDLKARWLQQRASAARLDDELQQARAALAQARLQLTLTEADVHRQRHRAEHDVLTLLPNRAHLQARLEQALAGGRPHRARPALLYLDLDGFKAVNDGHGHETGDELLRIVAQRLRGAIRSEDLVCRLGGDEFVCLLDNALDAEQLCRLACKLFDAVSAPASVGSVALCVRPSIGIAMCPSDGDTSSALLHSADAAMYRAKRRQTGYAFCDSNSHGDQLAGVA